MLISDWSSDVCSSDLHGAARPVLLHHRHGPEAPVRAPRPQPARHARQARQVRSHPARRSVLRPQGPGRDQRPVRAHPPPFRTSLASHYPPPTISVLGPRLPFTPLPFPPPRLPTTS